MFVDVFNGPKAVLIFAESLKVIERYGRGTRPCNAEYSRYNFILVHPSISPSFVGFFQSSRLEAWPRHAFGWTCRRTCHCLNTMTHTENMKHGNMKHESYVSGCQLIRGPGFVQPTSAPSLQTRKLHITRRSDKCRPTPMNALSAATWDGGEEEGGSLQSRIPESRCSRLCKEPQAPAGFDDNRPNDTI